MAGKTPKCQHCHKAFLPVRSGMKYCCTACRQAAYRARQRATQKPKKPTRPTRLARPALPLVVGTCLYCGGQFWAENRRQRFCRTSCRSLYARAARAALPDALTAFYGIPTHKAEDMIDALGMKRVRVMIEQAGYVYHHPTRHWWKVERKAKRRAA